MKKGKEGWKKGACHTVPRAPLSISILLRLCWGEEEAAESTLIDRVGIGEPSSSPPSIVMAAVAMCV